MLSFSYWFCNILRIYIAIYDNVTIFSTFRSNLIQIGLNCELAFHFPSVSISGFQCGVGCHVSSRMNLILTGLIYTTAYYILLHNNISTFWPFPNPISIYANLTELSNLFTTQGPRLGIQLPNTGRTQCT